MLAAAPTASAIVNGSSTPSTTTWSSSASSFSLRTAWRATERLQRRLVAPTVVLTAAHCTLLPPARRPGLSARSSARARPRGARIGCVGTYTLHPGFCIGCAGAPEGFANNDLAVVELSIPLPGPYANLPKLGFAGKHFDDKEKKLVAVGYGLRAPDGAARHATFSAGRRGRRLDANFLFLPVPSKKKYGTVCVGDSGGAALVGNTLVAIHSIGDDACGGPSYAYRLDTPDAQRFLSQNLDVRG